MKKLVALVMTALCLLAVGCSKQEDDQIIDVVVPSTPEAVVTPVPRDSRGNPRAGIYLPLYRADRSPEGQERRDRGLDKDTGH